MTERDLNEFLAITRALSDETRVRALLSLRGGELCLCQLIELLGLAPSTISKHMDVLRQAGLVERRRDGRWQHFRLARAPASPCVRQALAFATRSLADDPLLEADASRLARLREKDLADVSACYRETRPRAASGNAGRRRRP